MFTDALMFSLGWLFRAMVASVIVEGIVKPITTLIVGYATRSENRVLKHYFAKHPGKSWDCLICNKNPQT